MHSIVNFRSLIFSVIGIILVAASWVFLSDSNLKPNTAKPVHKVLSLSNQFDSAILEVAVPFEKLITETNEVLLSLSAESARYDNASAIVAWLSIIISIAITLIAAVFGVDPKQVQEQIATRTRVIKLIAILAALNSCSLIVDERLHKLSAQAKENSKGLYERASVARHAFLEAGKDRSAAEAAKDSLFLKLIEIGHAPS